MAAAGYNRRLLFYCPSKRRGCPSKCLVAAAVDIALENGCLGFDCKFNRRPRDESVEFLKRVPHRKSTWTAIAIAALPFAPVLSHTRHHASWQDDNNDHGHYEPESSFYSIMPRRL
jgi:hypothetical protein